MSVVSARFKGHCAIVSYCALHLLPTSFIHMAPGGDCQVTALLENPFIFDQAFGSDDVTATTKPMVSAQSVSP